MPAGSEERVLMPQSSPRPALRPPRRHADRGPRRFIDDRSEREYSALAEQLAALEHDIQAARELASTISGTPELTPRAEPAAAAPSPHGQPVTLDDGARILIRPIEPGDARDLERSFEQLGGVSRYRRFLTPIHRLSDRQLAYLTHVDHQSHEALVAVDPASGGIAGVARYVRDPGHRSRAEAVVVVADRWQGRGVGRALAEPLAARALRAGIDCLTARMLIGNDAGRALLARIADDVCEQQDAGAVDLLARLRTR